MMLTDLLFGCIIIKTTYKMGWDGFFAFFNGMVAGTFYCTQDGPKSSLCSPLKSSRFVFKHKPNRHQHTVAS